MLFAVTFAVGFGARTLLQKRRGWQRNPGRVSALGARIEWFAGWMLVVALVAAAAPVGELAGMDPWLESHWVRGFGVGVAVVGVVLTFGSQLSVVGFPLHRVVRRASR